MLYIKAIESVTRASEGVAPDSPGVGTVLI